MSRCCEECAYYEKRTKTALDGCFVEPGKRYIVWPERRACAQFKAAKQAVREEEQERIEEMLWANK